MTSTTDAPQPRATQPLALIFAGVGTGATMLGLVMTIGGWRATVDGKIEEIDRRLTTAESNQKTYIPVLVGLNKDVSYLAERARREDDRLERDRGRGR